jgi:low affinity Fe/Cu permease
MTFFDKFADRAAHFVSRAWFFVFCLALVVLWMPSLPLFGTVDTWQLVINTVTTCITFLLVALLQNTQWRGDKAINEKLDAIADGLSDTMESLAAVMDRLDIGDHEQRMLDQARELRETVGIEERISSSKPGHSAATGDYQPEEQRRAVSTG